ncbi:MAG TPA: LamG-like jellyroll fold domain-containing protein [Candidatus Sulfotelmatobacter sp.]|nr:LamG-like jellyroll fold domain-containing protein [Candidatus Sulfotelmatobacter sp.]
MKTVSRIKIQWLVTWLMALAVFDPPRSLAQDDTNNFSWLRLLPPGYWLDGWSFENANWDSDFGFVPLSYANIVQVPDWDGSALQVDTTNAAWLTYNIVQNAPGYGAYTNLTLDTGSIEFWFIPNWESEDTNYYGSGPGNFGRLIEVGTWATNEDSDWWSLYLNPSGTSIYFSSGTNGVRTNYLSAPISWDGSTWEMIDVTYSPTDTAIYINGRLAATGDGVLYVPSGDILTNGFSIGSDFATGIQQAHGQFDDLYTYDYQLNAGEIADDYADVYPELPGTFHAMDGEEPPLPGGGSGGGGSGDDGGDGGGSPLPNYGTNLWLALGGMTNDMLTLLATNTQPDILYEIQETTNLLAGWSSYAFIDGSELTNWTPASAPIGSTGQTFFRIRSWQSIDGIPLWWFLANLGQDTNVSGEMFAPSGDGWTLLQCYEAGISPTNWVQPPAPQGLTVTSFNSTNNTATLSWMLSAGPVQGYIVQTPNGTNIVGNGVNYYTDNSSSPSATYSIQAIYGGGLSAWSPSVSVEAFASQGGSGSSGESSLQNVASADFAPGPDGNTCLALGGIPTNAVAIQLQFVDFLGYGPTTTYNIPVSAITNGIYQLPMSWSPPSDQGPGNTFYEYIAYVQTLDANSNASPAYYFSSDTAGSGYWLQSWNWSTPYFDGREQLKQNLTFLLREPVGDSPFSCGFTEPYGYAYASYYDTLSPDENSFDDYLPFDGNYYYRNFVFGSDDIDPNDGALTTGINTNEFENSTLAFSSSPTYQFQPPAEQTNVPALLATNVAQWLISYPFEALYPGRDTTVFYDLTNIGVTYTYDLNTGGTTFIMNGGAVNSFGLPIESVNIAYNDGNFETNLLTPNSSTPEIYPYSDPYAYVQTTAPRFQTVGYDFWNVSRYLYFQYGSEYIGSPVPGNPSFTPTNTSDLLITHIGDTEFQIAGYAKLAVTNSIYSSVGVYGYLGQYFANAYQIDSNGNVTSNSAGVLSPYGQFFATEPGQAALETMPDPDTGLQGTGVVDVISLNVDANHDGMMDFSFTGPDFVGPNNPYRFWVNDDIDCGDTTGDGIPGQGTNGDGMTQIEVPTVTPYYSSDYPTWAIHGRRDLVDFFPVCVNISSLFQSNSLSTGISATDTNWQFVLSQNDGVLRFAYTDLTPTNYMNFLLDTNESGKLAYTPGYLTYAPLTTITNLASGGTPLSRSFIAGIAASNQNIILVEAAAPTTQPIVLTVYHGTNQIAQTSLYLSISEVEQMFRHKNCLLTPQPNEIPDRLTAASVTNEPPTNDKNFIFVHGYNVNTTQARGWDSDIFKRLYWSGSHAKFYGVTWEAADSQVADAVTINLQTNIVNAFNTAPLLNSFLNSLSGTNVVAAHSLGNMLVLSTLNDCTNQSINTYFMIDAAVAIEAIDTTAASNPDMYSSAWTNYNSNLWASKWFNLWPANDARSTLTWSGRLTNFQNTAVYNFYSSGEEVLRDYPSDPPVVLSSIAALEGVYAAEGETGEYAWAWQEKNKGLMAANDILSSNHGGWLFNHDYTSLTVAEANALPNSELQTNAFFYFSAIPGSTAPFNSDLALETSSGSSYAQANRNRILSDAIPCLTLPVGANPVPRLAPQNANDENYDEQADFENGWPADRHTATLYGATAAGEWHHSDIRAVAYTFTYPLFNQIVTLGNLQ